MQGIVPALQAKLQALMQLSKAKFIEYNATDVSYKGGGIPQAKLPTEVIPTRPSMKVATKEAGDALLKMRSKSS